MNRPTKMNSIATSNYNQNARDSQTLDYQETILGHLLAEQHHSLENALTYLASYAKEEKSVWEHCESVSSAGFWVGLVCGGVSFLAVGSGPIGLAIGGTIAAIGSGGSYWLKDLSERVGALRRTEFELHKHHPWIRDRLWELSQQGASTAQLVAIYDQMVFHMFANGIPTDRNTIAGTMSINPNAQDDKPEIQSQQGFQNNDSHIAPRAKDETLAISGVQPIAIAQDATTAAPPSIQHIVSPVWNPAQDLGENPQSALIVGTPGSGKGVTVSNAVRVLKSQNPALTVMMIDPKGDPNERGYWEPVTDIFESFALMDCLDPDEGAEWLLRCMSKFQKLPAPKLLIFDELLAASIELEMADKSMKALPKLKKFMAGIVAQGDSKGVWVWAMSQSPQCSDLGLNGGVRGNLRIIAIVSPKNKTAIQVITSTKLVPMVEGGMDELDKIMAASPVGRAVFDG
ncbi:MAG: hypothetical protein NT070_02980, partial [Cyanobacteria bacterium]|nr:hypothetical protein [Cyanobacteriota bacterium]